MVEEQYGWTRDTLCGPLRKTLTTTTTVLQGEIRYELRVSDGKRPQRTQRTVSAGAVIRGVGGSTTVPSDGDPFIERLGPDTMAGQPCARTMTKSPLSGAAVTTMCVFVVPRSCKLALLVKVLDLQSTVAGALLNHGRPSLLRVGGPGKMFVPGAFSPP